jgi:hypothetical protein
MLNKKDDLPYFPFYIGDWRKATDVQALPRDVRSVWFDMLCYMWESTERGYLTVNGKPIPDDSLASMLGLPVDLLKQNVKVILDFGVASIRESDGALYSRRMVKDQELRIIRQKAGSVGGKKSYASRFAQANIEANTENENDIENENESTNEKTVKEKDVEQVRMHWNSFASSFGLSEIIKMTDKRISGVKNRLMDDSFKFDNILMEIKQSKFMRGENSSGWKVDFDFIFCSANNYLKILEGKYRDGTTNKNNGSFRNSKAGGSTTLEDVQRTIAKAYFHSD